MPLFDDSLVVVRGGGDLATGVVYRLHKAGFPVIVLELPQPLVVRRRVALATAVLEGEINIEGMTGRLVATLGEALELAPTGLIPVLIAPELSAISFQPSAPDPHSPIPSPRPRILIDGRMAKRNIDTRIDQAHLVIALGPGFTAGVDCHAVIETMRGHRLGRVIGQGSALPNTGTPGIVAGKGAERVLRAPVAGVVDWLVEIGDRVPAGQPLGSVAGEPVVAPFDGVLRGLIAPGTAVWPNLKIGDLDARADVSACFTISDKALAIGGGVLEAILSSPLPFNNVSLAASAALSLQNALAIQGSGELVAFTGGGGKTSLMFALAHALPGHIVTTTTTRIFAAQMEMAPAVCSTGDLSKLALNLSRFGHCLVVGHVEGEKAVGVDAALPGRLLSRPDVDFVLVEADGSRLRPCKAPADHEPVIPAETSLVVPVVGIDAVGGRLADVAHRPELVSYITGLQPDDVMTPAALATLISHPSGGLKGAPATARLIPFINKVETAEQLTAAREIARLTLQEPRIEQVVIGAVRTARPVREIHKRMTAVVLAAGQASRMGQTKQLLPWGDTTVLGQTLRNLRQTAVHDILVVSGHDKELVEAIATEYSVTAVHNPHYAGGEMLSSLQTAVHNLPDNRTAVLVILADQPMIEAVIMDQLLVAYWQGKGELIAPVYQGQRGNPVLIGKAYFNALLALPQGAAPRDLLKQHDAQLHLVEVNSDTILRDLDRPEDYERWWPEK